MHVHVHVVHVHVHVHVGVFVCVGVASSLLYIHTNAFIEPFHVYMCTYHVQSNFLQAYMYKTEQLKAAPLAHSLGVVLLVSAYTCPLLPPSHTPYVPSWGCLCEIPHQHIRSIKSDTNLCGLLNASPLTLVTPERSAC